MKMNKAETRALIGLSATDIKLVFRAFDTLEDTEGTSQSMDELTNKLYIALQDIEGRDDWLRAGSLDDDTAEISKR
tara:strand:+ start:569 stop:796 length:228 start_codon:yes stop_codon:yes gene_type:complete